ncbi:MAG: hypothetical protein FIA95_06130 [Gemmatimonadetes bacterium]|nr:hypothetical protein [Gemmatimonadota bacterium]
MSSESSIWFRLGYALERSRQAPASGARKLAKLRERRPESQARRLLPPPAEWPSADQLVASGAVALAAKALDAWRPRHRTGAKDLLKAGLSGAAAALALEAVRPLLQGRAEFPQLDPRTVERILVGAGQGLVYGAVVEPRLPGPALVKGAVYGSAEYAVDPMGGIARLLGSQAPLRRVPVLGALMDGLTPHDRSYVEHVAFGIAVALIYGSSPSRSGILDEDDA